MFRLKSSKRKTKSVVDPRVYKKTREKFRQHLLEVIVGKTGEDSEKPEIEVPDLVSVIEGDLEALYRKEPWLLRYQFYIRNGISISDVASWETSPACRVFAKYRTKAFNKNVKTLHQLELEAKVEYYFFLRKASIDFVLSYGYFSLNEHRQFKTNHDRRLETQRTRRKLRKLLVITDPCMRAILDTWNLKFRKLLLFDSKEIQGQVWDLPNLNRKLAEQVAHGIQILNQDCFTTIGHILLQGQRRRVAPLSGQRLETIQRATDVLMAEFLQKLCVENLQTYQQYFISCCQHTLAVDVIWNQQEIALEPSPETVSQALVQHCRHICEAVQSYPSCGSLGEDLDPKSLLNVPLPELELSRGSHALSTEVEGAMCQAKTMLEKFAELVPLLNGSLQSDTQSLIEQNELNAMQAKVLELQNLQKSVRQNLAATLVTGNYQLRLNSLRNSVMEALQGLISLLLSAILEAWTKEARKLCEQHAESADVALTVPVHTHHLIAQQEKVVAMRQATLPAFKQELRANLLLICFVSDHMTLDPQTSFLAKEMLAWDARLKAALTEHGRILQKKRKDYEEKLKKRRELLIEALKSYGILAEEFQRMGELDCLPDYLHRSRALAAQLYEAEVTVKQINAEEKAFGWMTTDYPALSQVKATMNPYWQLFEVASKFFDQQKVWMESQIGTFDPDFIIQETEKFKEAVATAEERFADTSDTRFLLNQVESRLFDFNRILPLIGTLGNPTLRERHWDQVSDAVGLRLRAEPSNTLQYIVGLGLHEHLPRFELISHAATQESLLELSLQAMKGAWKNVTVPMENYNTASYYVLGDTEPLQRLLEDHIVETQIMRRSPFIKPFEKDIKDWESQLLALQDLLDQCCQAQKAWSQLEPVLAGPDVYSYAPEEARKFSTIDKSWRDILGIISGCEQVFGLLKISSLAERLQLCAQQIKLIQSGLKNLLEKKRSHYPRFYFLAESELHALLAGAKTSATFSMHLWKLFPGIKELTFDKDQNVIAVSSPYHEVLTLVDPVPFTTGQVEKFLSRLEVEVQSTFEQHVRSAQLTRQPSTELVALPAQAVIYALVLEWTRIFDKATEDFQWTECQNQLKLLFDNYLKLLENPDRAIDLHLRRSLLLFKLYSRDLLKRLRSTDTPGFTWYLQYRFYTQEERLLVKVADSQFSNTLEYYGGAFVPRMSLTSDESQATFCGSLRWYMGSLVDGATGSGKLSLVQDLARAISQLLYIFECSGVTLAESITSFIKGSIACSAWLCLHEVDHLVSSVLDHMRDMLIQLLRGVNTGGLEGHPLLEGLEIGVNSKWALFGTADSHMNAVTKAKLAMLFRPIHFQAPDLLLTIQTKLFVRGFKSPELPNRVLNLLNALEEIQFPGTGAKLLLFQRILDSLEGSEVGKRTELEIIAGAFFDWGVETLPQEATVKLMKTLESTFPEIKFKRTVPADLVKICQKVCAELNLEFSPLLLEKSYQVYHAFRQGNPVIVTGDVMSGRTTCVHVARAIWNARQETKIRVFYINSAAYEETHLFGNTKMSYRDGLITSLLKQSHNEKIMLHFSGPICPSIFENLLNTLVSERVMQLKSGEKIFIDNQKLFVFETNDLEETTPAMVAACQIVHTGPNLVTWQNLVKGWLASVEKLSSWRLILPHWRTLLNSVVPKLIHFVSQSHHEIPASSPLEIKIAVQNLLQILSALSHPVLEEKQKKALDSDTRAALEAYVYFAGIWSFGMPYFLSRKRSFDKVMKELVETDFAQDRVQCPSFPKEGTVFDYKFVRQTGNKGTWVSWTEELKTGFTLSRDLPVNQLLVPTANSLRAQYFVQLLSSRNIPTVLLGPVACGKTAIAMDMLRHKLDARTHEYITYNCSLRTTVDRFQQVLMGKLQKRRQGVYGPSLGKKAFFFLDSFMMHSTHAPDQRNGAEFLRQWIEHNQIYDLQSHVPVIVSDVDVLVTARPDNVNLNSSVMRHFVRIPIQPITNDGLVSIFNRILLWHLDARGFGKEFDPCIEEIVAASMAIYQAVQNRFASTRQYFCEWSVHDFARCIQGVLLSVPETTEDLQAMKRLWIHEALRVFSDRLSALDDIKWLTSQVQASCKDHLHEDFHQLLAHLDLAGDGEVTEDDLRHLLFCDFSDPKSDARSYVEVIDHEHLLTIVEGYVKEFNNMNRRPLPYFVIFRYIVELLGRVSRIIKQPGGHAILVGHHGVGKNSTARIATHVSDSDLVYAEFSRVPQLSEWKTGLKNALTRAAAEEKKCVLLVSETEADNYGYLEEVCHLLGGGDPMYLFSPEDRTAIIETMRAIDLQKEKSLQTDGSAAALLAMFERRLLDQLHIILVTSPDSRLGEKLAIFPQLSVVCQTVWVQPWPEEAADCLASKFCKDVELSQQERELMCKLAYYMYQTMGIKDDVMCYAALIDSILIFAQFIALRKRELQQKAELCSAAGAKLAQAAEAVRFLEEELISLRKELNDAITMMEELTDSLERFNQEYAQIEAEAQKHEKAAQQLREAHETKKEEIRNVAGQLQNAEENVKQLSVADLTVLKSMRNPPSSVQLIFEALYYLKGSKSEKTPGSGSTQKTVTEDVLAAGKKVLSDPKSLEALVDVSWESYHDSLQVIRERVLNRPELDENELRSTSTAADKLFTWIGCLASYDLLLQELNESTDSKLVDTSNGSSSIQQKYREGKNHREALEGKLSELRERQSILERDIELKVVQVDRGKDLLSNLAPYGAKWETNLSAIQSLASKAIPDCIMLAGYCVYFAGENSHLREEGLRQWTSFCTENGIDCTLGLEVNTLLSKEKLNLRAKWISASLPTDDHLIDSVVMLKFLKRWPLFIDPFGLGVQWLLTQCQDNPPLLLRLSSPDYLTQLAGSIQLGGSVILDIDDALWDACLMPVILRQTFLQGSTHFIRLNDNTIEYSPEFTLYLVTRRQEVPISHPAYLHVSRVSFVPSDVGIQDVLTSALASSERPDGEERSQLALQVRDLHKQYEDGDTSLLKVISNAAGNLVQEESVITAILPVLAQCQMLNDKEALIEQTASRLESQRHAYLGTAHYGTDLFKMLQRLTSVVPYFVLTLEKFAQMLVASLDEEEESGSPGTGDEETTGNTAKRTAIYVFKQLRVVTLRQHRLLLALVVAISVSMEELRDSTGFSALLSEDSRTEVMKLPGMEEVLQTLEENVEFHQSEEPWLVLENCAEVLANPWHRFLVCHALRPQCSQSTCVHYNKSIFGDDLATNGSPDWTFVGEMPSSVPLLLLTNPELDVIRLIFQVAKEQDFPDDRIRISSVAGSGEVIWDEIEDAMRRGNWLVLLSCHQLRNADYCMAKILEILSGESTSPDVRIWLIWDSTAEYWPPSLMLTQSKLIAVDSPNAINDVVSELLEEQEMSLIKANPSLARQAATLALWHGSLTEKFSIVLPKLEYTANLHQALSFNNVGIEPNEGRVFEQWSHLASFTYSQRVGIDKEFSFDPDSNSFESLIEQLASQLLIRTPVTSWSLVPLEEQKKREVSSRNSDVISELKQVFS